MFPVSPSTNFGTRWAAICRGAVLRGHGNDIVINHISKYNYGCSFRPEFVNGKHLEQDRNYDELLGYDVAENQIRWFLNRVTLPHLHLGIDY